MPDLIVQNTMMVAEMYDNSLLSALKWGERDERGHQFLMLFIGQLASDARERAAAMNTCPQEKNVINSVIKKEAKKSQAC